MAERPHDDARRIIAGSGGALPTDLVCGRPFVEAAHPALATAYPALQWFRFIRQGSHVTAYNPETGEALQWMDGEDDED